MTFGDPFEPSGPEIEEGEIADDEALDDPGEDGDDEELPAVVAIPLEEHLDLHGFLPADMHEIVRDYLDQAWEAGFIEIRIIHGRGIGAMRDQVRTLLSNDARIERCAAAPRERGGDGATLAWFRR